MTYVPRSTRGTSLFQELEQSSSNLYEGAELGSCFSGPGSVKQKFYNDEEDEWMQRNTERQRRNTKKYNFRQPDLKELWNSTSYVLDPLGFKTRFGKLLPFLTTQVDEGLMSVLVQFYDPLYRCFTFPDFQLLLTLEEYAYLVGIPILDQLSLSGFESIPTSQAIADMLHIDESLVGAHMTTKVGIQGLPSEFLIAHTTMYGKAMSEDAFEAIFVLLIYGLVLFPIIDRFVDVNAIKIFSTLNPVPTLLGDTYFSLHMRNAKGGGAIVCCLPLLYKWFISHLPQTVAFKENKGCLRWSTRLMSLTNDCSGVFVTIRDID
ncbi:hypothetical protein KIW84_021376 [Lathyrus oleraceus]|uniref:DUF7745 domain-containing protein n=1 Tax=Pisum sativum TaxID=3888 RepID=A0A9D4Y893_PEA|nr:hypothetical protein KIW84_021376 [Pisum sativum]